MVIRQIDTNEEWATDVFFSTGEKSGDILAADVYRELCNVCHLRPKAAALGGVHSSSAGIRNLLKRPDLYLIGLIPKKFREWERIFSIIEKELRLYPTKVFVGITHHTFNLPLAAEIGDRSAKILVSPSEIWAWQSNLFTKVLYYFFLRYFQDTKWLKHAPEGTLRRSLYTYIKTFCIAAVRGKLALQNFDKLVFLNPICQDAYVKYRKRCKSEAEFVFVGHPASTYSRSTFKKESHAFRKYNMVPEGEHILAIFPGSRETSIEHILPITLEIATNTLKKYASLRCFVSVADKCFAPYIDSQIRLFRKKLDSPYRLSASNVDSRVLLCASSHALLSAGTITLEAACLGVPGTVVYDLEKKIKYLAKLFAKWQKIGKARMCHVPFALPNIILAWKDYPQEMWPYQEFVLSRKFFEAGQISASIDQYLCRLPRVYSEDNPPLIDEEIIEIVRTAFSSPSESKTPQRLIAEEIARHMEEVTRTKNVR